MSDELSFPALDDVQGKIDDRNKKMALAFEEAGEGIDFTKIKSIPGDSYAKRDQIAKWNDELTELGKDRDKLLAVRKAAERHVAGVTNVPDPDEGGEGGSDNGRAKTSNGAVKSFGELFTESKAFRERNRGGPGPESHLDIELKTLFETTNGWAPETTRTGRVVDFATRPIQVTDVIPPGQTSQNSVVYMEATVFTNTAAERAEGVAYPEATLEVEEKSSPVRKIAVFLPITDEQLEDEPQARGYVNNRLPFMVRQRLDGQILTGDGTPPNLRGILATVGIQTQAKGTDPTPDAVYKGLVLVRVTGRAMPNAAIFHPTDWQDIRLLRTADGLYIWGNPSDAGPERIWGLNVVQSDAITLNTALVGDFANYSELTVRRGIDVQISNSHASFFTEGKQAVRADMRAALVVYRPAAFATITGI